MLPLTSLASPFDHLVMRLLYVKNTLGFEEVIGVRCFYDNNKVD